MGRSRQHSGAERRAPVPCALAGATTTRLARVSTGRPSTSGVSARELGMRSKELWRAASSRLVWMANSLSRSGRSCCAGGAYWDSLLETDATPAREVSPRRLAWAARQQSPLVRRVGSPWPALAVSAAEFATLMQGHLASSMIALAERRWLGVAAVSAQRGPGRLAVFAAAALRSPGLNLESTPPWSVL